MIGDDASPTRRIVAAAVIAVMAATLAVIVTALTLPGRTSQALHWYLVVLGAIAVVAALRAITARYPVQWRASPDRTRLATPDTDERPARLRAIERVVAHATYDSVAFQTELRPILRAIAAQRLATYWTVDIDRQPEAARAILGEATWVFLTPGDLETARGERGVDGAALRAVVERLEALDVVTHA
jgi:hypothetical protein